MFVEILSEYLENYTVFQYTASGEVVQKIHAYFVHGEQNTVRIKCSGTTVRDSGQRWAFIVPGGKNVSQDLGMPRNTEIWYEGPIVWGYAVVEATRRLIHLYKLSSITSWPTTGQTYGRRD